MPARSPWIHSAVSAGPRIRAGTPVDGISLHPALVVITLASVPWKHDHGPPRRVPLPHSVSWTSL
jgi:hypothetical protein